MADNEAMNPQQDPAAVKDPEEWTTGDEPVTAAQGSYLQTLGQQAGEEIDLSNLTKAQASEEINRLQEATGRGGGQQSAGA